MAGSETAQTFEFVVEGAALAGANLPNQKDNKLSRNRLEHCNVWPTTRTVAAPGGGFTRKVNVVFILAISNCSFKHNGVEQLTLAETSNINYVDASNGSRRTG